jgi:SnoaL-like domain
MSELAADKVAIREVIENWLIWRDSGDWERFRGVWHEDGRMMATWFQGTAEEFIRVSREGMDHGVSIFHTLGGISLEIAGTRAVAQTRTTISQRGLVHGVLCDVNCTGRFYDFFEKRNGRWAIVLRRLTYEKDRMDPVDPSETISLDKELLGRFPEGYRHLAYLQTNLGFIVRTDLPGLKGPEVEALYDRGKRWLAGEPL